MRSERPRSANSLRTRLAHLLAGSRIARRDSHVAALLERIRRTGDRAELEALVGQPIYALDGKLYSSDGRSPQVVEVYHSSGVIIELWFSDDRVMYIVGYRTPPGWNRVDSN